VCRVDFVTSWLHFGPKTLRT